MSSSCELKNYTKNISNNNFVLNNGSMAVVEDRIIRVCIVGAGLGGLCAAVQIKKQFLKQQAQLSLVVYEQNADVGGVWLTNSYPGAQADIPGHMYCYSFKQNPNWTTACPVQAEMWNYIHNVANDYDLYSYIQFNTTVTNMEWISSECLWRVTTSIKNPECKDNIESISDFDITILATGPFHTPNIPSGLANFSGPWLHSGRWDSSVSFEGKVVGVVGNGASGVQIIPSIVDKTKELVVYSRSPLYVVPKLEYQVPRCLQWAFKYLPGFLWLFRALMFLISEIGELPLKAGSCANWFGQRVILRLMKWKLSDPVLYAQLKPKHKIGSKPAVLTNWYLQVFKRPNVNHISSRISKVEGRTVTTEDGQNKDLDVLILCTGFKVQDYFAPIVIKGLNGADVLKCWKQDRPNTFYGITSHATPNCFFILGPNSIPPHTSATFVIECQVNLITQILQQFIKHNYGFVQIKTDAQEKCMAAIVRDSKKVMYGQFAQNFESNVESSWVANEKGDVTTWCPYSGISYWWKTRSLNKDQFNWVDNAPKNKSSSMIKSNNSSNCNGGSEKQGGRLEEDIMIV